MVVMTHNGGPMVVMTQQWRPHGGNDTQWRPHGGNDTTMEVLRHGMQQLHIHLYITRRMIIGRIESALPAVPPAYIAFFSACKLRTIV